MSSEATLGRLLTSGQFHAGLAWGGAASGIGRLVDRWPPLRSRAASAGGVLLTAAVAAAVAVTVGLPRTILVDLVVLVMAAALVERVGAGAPGVAVVAVVPAIVLVHRSPLHGAIPQAAVVAMIVLGGALAGETGERWGGGLPFVAVAVTAAGMWACLPDTEGARAALGATLAGGFIGWPGARVRLGRAGASALCLVLAWVVATGARGRPAAAIGAATCLGLLVAAPLGHLVARRWWAATTPMPGPLAMAGHAVVVGVASRSAGLLRSSRRAAAIAAVDLIMAVLAVALAGRRWREPGSGGPGSSAPGHPGQPE